MQFLLGFILSFSSICAHADLEENISPFALKTKQIIVPGYPHAFNPSVIKWEDHYLMSFRVIPPLSAFSLVHSASESQIGIVRLDSNFEPVGVPQILDLDHNKNSPTRAEDARLICSCNKIYLVYSDNEELIVTEGGFRMYVAELKEIDGIYFTFKKTVILHFEGENRNRREKNWTPFDYCGNLLLSYGINPHRILLPNFSSTYADTLFSTKQEIKWDYGELRGGTPALLDDDEYLSFFHSSKLMPSKHSNGKPVLHYFMGAYTFNKEPPFEVTKISETPIIATGFYEGINYEPYWKPVRVVFPCGFVIDEHYVYVAYGRQDHEIWIIKLDKQGLKNSLRSL